MKELIQLFTQIALLKRGPQDLPASKLLLVLTVIGYALVNIIISVLLPTDQAWGPPLAVDVAFTLLWYVVLLKIVGRPERILQTTTAVFGFQAVLSPPVDLSEWLLQRAGENPAWQLPAILIYVVLLLWVIAASSHIVQAALEWSGFASVGVVFVELIAGLLLQAAIFPVHG